MKTIAIIIHQNKFPLRILDSDGNLIYFEVREGFWSKRQFNSTGFQTFYEHSTGYIMDNRKNEINRRNTTS